MIILSLLKKRSLVELVVVDTRVTFANLMTSLIKFFKFSLTFSNALVWNLNSCFKYGKQFRRSNVKQFYTNSIDRKSYRQGRPLKTFSNFSLFIISEIEVLKVQVGTYNFG